MARVVLITSDAAHGRRILQAVAGRRLTLDAVLYVAGDFGFPDRRGLSFVGRLLRWPKWSIAAARRRRAFRRDRHHEYAQHSTRVIATGLVNSRALVRDLRALAPDWIVVAVGDILSTEVIETARCGVLNAHPGLLPWIRGNGVTGASLEENIAIGATVHLVDRGIDTGPIIERRLLDVAPGSASLAALEAGALALAAAMMADTIESVVRGNNPIGVAQDTRHALFRWPDASGLARRQALAAAGRAHALYRAWLPLSAGSERAVLPPGNFDIPKAP